MPSRRTCPGEMKKCEGCGADFVTEGPKQVFCKFDACLADRAQARAEAYAAKHGKDYRRSYDRYRPGGWKKNKGKKDANVL